MRSPSICPECGAPLPANAPKGLCPKCLLADLVTVGSEFPQDDIVSEDFAGLAGEKVHYFGDYELLGEIARGGMGVVYRARQISLDRPVALKMILTGQLANATEVARFHTEAEAAARLEHPNIVPIHEIGEWEGRQYFSMKLIEGRNLSEEVSGKPLSPIRAATLLGKMAHAVHYAHQRGILHRDLKPTNILLDAEGEPYLTDFGLAKLVESESSLTGSMAVMGSAPYMSPEQAGGHAKELTTAADIYSLGAILYELLTGRPPFQAGTLIETLRQVAEKEPEPPQNLNREVDRDLATICLKCLQKEPRRRYAAALALAEDLERWLHGEPIRARRTTLPEHALKWTRRNPSLAALIGITVISLVAGVAGIAIQWRRAEAAERAIRVRLAHEHIRTGLRMAGEGDSLRGLPHYVEALRLGLGDVARERVARLRFEMTMRQTPRLAQLWLPERTADVQFAEESGRVVITAGSETRVWDATIGAAVSPQIRHTRGLVHTWTDPLGSRVVTETGGKQITVWDSTTGQAIVTLPGEGHLRAVLGGLRLRLAARQRETGTIICLSAFDGAVDATLSHPEIIEWAVASPDGTRVLAATKRSLVLWDVASRTLVVPPVDFGGEPDFGNFDPSGHLAGLRVKHEDGIAVFDLTTGAITTRGATKSIGSIRHGWLDGTRWVVLSRKLIGSALRDGATDRLLFDVPIGTGTAAADFAARRNVFALAGENGASQLWNAETAQPLTPRLWAGGRPDHIRLSADGKTFLTSSSEPAVRLWKVPAQCGAEWRADGTVPPLVAWWNGGLLRTVGVDARLYARDAATGPSGGRGT